MIPFQTDDYETNPGFVERVNQIVFPDLQPENLVLPHRNFIINGLVLAQTHIACLRESNVSFFTKSDAVDNCNVSIIANAPRGRIHGVFAFKPCMGCTKHLYHQRSTGHIMRYVDKWAVRGCRDESDICNTSLNGYLRCLPPYTSDVEDDSTFACDPEKNFAYGVKNKLYLAPRFPCGYIVGVIWEGIKRSYSNDDLVTDDPDVIDMIAIYLEGERALRIDRDIERWREIMRPPRPSLRDAGGSFWQKLAAVAHRCREERRIRKTVYNEDLFDDSALSHFNVSALEPVPAVPDEMCEWTGYGDDGGSGGDGSCPDGQFRGADDQCHECTTPTVQITASKNSIVVHQAVTIGYASNVPNNSSSVVTIEWENNSVTVPKNTSGTMSFFPLVSTSYTIRAVTDCGNISQTVDVSVNEQPDGCNCPPDDASQKFAFIADWGDSTNDFLFSKPVQDAVQAFDPLAIFTGGDNRYGPVGEGPATIVNVLAAHDYYRAMFDACKFWPGIGNHDTDDGLGIDEWFQFCPPADTQRNYSKRIGLVEFFHRETHDTGSHVPTTEELQDSSAWLHDALANSTARWKIVITQDPPWTSHPGDGPSHIQSQLPYQDWGADVVLSGDSHQYERFSVNGYPTIVAGCGGRPLDTEFMDPPVTGSVFRNGTDHGFLGITANNNELRIQFINTASETLDELVISKPCCLKIDGYTDGLIEDCVDGEPSNQTLWDGVLECAGVCQWGFPFGQKKMSGKDISAYIVLSGCSPTNTYELTVVTRNLDNSTNIAWQGQSVGAMAGVYTRTAGCGPDTLTITTCYECLPPEAVTFDPPTGSAVTPGTFVLLHSSDDSTIFYTTDGSEPTNASNLYTGPFQLPDGATVVKAIAYSNTCHSDVTTATYEVLQDFVFQYLCKQNVDYVGQFYEFYPNSNIGEYMWNLHFKLPNGGDLKRLEIYETNPAGVWVTGQAWATDNPVFPEELHGAPFSIYPLVILDGGTQVNTEYKTTLYPGIGNAERNWVLYGQPFIPLTGYFKLKLTYVEDYVEKTLYSVITNQCYYYNYDYFVNGGGGGWVNNGDVSDDIINVDIRPNSDPSSKIGEAAVGLSGDFWNSFPIVTVDGLPEPVNLKWANGQNVMGAHQQTKLFHLTDPSDRRIFSSAEFNADNSDPMMKWAGKTENTPGIYKRLAFIDLPRGSYDVYVYGHGPNMNDILKCNLGTPIQTFSEKSTADGLGWLTNFTEGQGYVVWRSFSWFPEEQTDLYIWFPFLGIGEDASYYITGIQLKRVL